MPLERSSAPILVVGHTSPDTDAVCSAMAYASFYRALTGTPTVACHLDELAPETRWVLDHFNLPAPQAIADVYLHVHDVMDRDVPHLRPHQTIREAGLLMQELGVRALPVVDEDDRLIGLVERDALADRYLAQLQLSEEVDLPVLLLIHTLHATLVTGDAERRLRDRAWIATMRAEMVQHMIAPGDIVIVGDQPDVQQAAIQAGAGCLILTEDAPLDQAVVAAASERPIVLLQTRYSPFAVALLLQQSVPIERVMNAHPPHCQEDDLLSEAQTSLRRSGLASLPVVNVRGQLQGVLMRRSLTAQGRRRVILTDHNHPDQTAPGVTESEIVAIVDHHNLGGLQTLSPLTIICEPLGCTCTLIAELYQRHQIALSPNLAGGMLAAILSDTVHFRSPTTTPRDRAAAAWLEQQSSQDATTLARAIFRARLPKPTPPAAWWVESNLKAYSFGDETIGIGQIELTDIEQVMPPVELLRAELARVAQQRQMLTTFLMLTDILGEYSLLLTADALGDQIAERAFGQPFGIGHNQLDHVMSRKKQVLPRIAAALADRL